MSFYKEVPGRRTTLESTLKFDTEPKAGSTNPVTSDGVKGAIDGAVGDAAAALQEQIDEIAEKAGSGYIPKGEATVATLNGLSGQENGELYTMTDAGTLTEGSLAVVAGDTVAWDATNNVWYKAMDYAPRQYGTNEAHNLPTTITAFRTGDVIPVDGPSGTAKMRKDSLLAITAQNTAASGLVATSEQLDDVNGILGNYNFKQTITSDQWAVDEIHVDMKAGIEYAIARETTGSFNVYLDSGKQTLIAEVRVATPSVNYTPQSDLTHLYVENVSTPVRTFTILVTSNTNRLDLMESNIAENKTRIVSATHKSDVSQLELEKKSTFSVFFATQLIKLDVSLKAHTIYKLSSVSAISAYTTESKTTQIGSTDLRTPTYLMPRTDMEGLWLEVYNPNAVGKFRSVTIENLSDENCCAKLDEEINGTSALNQPTYLEDTVNKYGVFNNIPIYYSFKKGVEYTLTFGHTFVGTATIFSDSEYTDVIADVDGDSVSFKLDNDYDKLFIYSYSSSDYGIFSLTISNKECIANDVKNLKERTSRKKIIYVTDFGGDQDDIANIAVLCWGENTGRIDIMAIEELYEIYGTKNGVTYNGISAADALFQYFGIKEIPFALNKQFINNKDYNSVDPDNPLNKCRRWTSKYCSSLMAFPHTRQSNDDSYDSVTMYRKLLASLPEGEKVEICVAGQVAGLSRLIDSSADSISPLTGLELLNAKCERIWMTGGTYPVGEIDTNTAGNSVGLKSIITASNNVFSNFTGEIVFFGADSGVAWGVSLYDEDIDWSPVYAAMTEFCANPPAGMTSEQYWKSRQAPEAVMLMCVIDGAIFDGYDFVRGTNRIENDTTSPDYAKNVFTPSEDGKHCYITFAKNKKFIQHRMNQIFTEKYWPPKNPKGIERLKNGTYHKSEYDVSFTPSAQGNQTIPVVLKTNHSYTFSMEGYLTGNRQINFYSSADWSEASFWGQFNSITNEVYFRSYRNGADMPIAYWAPTGSEFTIHVVEEWYA